MKYLLLFLAPLTMTDEQMEKGLEIFEETLKEALKRIADKQTIRTEIKIYGQNEQQVKERV